MQRTNSVFYSMLNTHNCLAQCRLRAVSTRWLQNATAS